MTTRFRYILAAIMLILLGYGISASAQPTLTYDVTGLEKGPALKNAKTRLQLNQKVEAKKLEPKTIKKIFEQGPDVIKTGIQPYGYFKASIAARLTREGNAWTAHYHITPGTPLSITELNVKVIGAGSKNKKIINLLKKLPIKEGDVFTADAYQKTKTQLLNTAEAEGFLRATLTKTSINIHLHNYLCIIRIEMNTGPRFYFGNTSFTKTPLNESLLRRYLNYKKGEPVSHDKLLKLQQLLSGSGYFQSISAIAVMKKERNKKVPVRVALKMQKRKAYRFGIGYGTNSGPRGTIGFDVNWLNRYGHQLKTLLKASHIQTSLAAQYLIPGSKPAYEHYAINASIFEQRPRDGESLTKSIGVAYIRNFNVWQRTVGLNFEYERYRFTSHERYRRSKLLFPNIRFSRTVSNDAINPTDGSNFTINFIGASEDVASSVSFLQTKVDYTKIYSLTKNNRFVIRGSYGYTLTGNKLKKLPLSKHFYTGGINSVRGYRYMNIGPGRFLVVGSAEYQRRIYGNWFGALFYDIGNAMNHFDTPYKRGEGLGIVWDSPMGPLRLYFARAMSDSDRPWRIEFSFGPSI